MSGNRAIGTSGQITPEGIQRSFCKARSESATNTFLVTFKGATWR
jgi:hypothetical protein